MNRCTLRGLALAICSFAIPLLFIGLSAIISDWFNLYNNALSDLGHAVKSRAAPIFNLGLSFGGVLMATFALKYISAFNRVLEYLVVMASYSLILIAVFDEVYGKLHFAVSVLFFVLVLLLVLLYGFILKSSRITLVALALVLLNAILWGMHFAIGIPRGAAIPELVSIFTVVPFYLHLAKISLIRVCKER